MTKLADSLKAWPSADFKRVLKGELERLEPGRLPLQQGLSVSSHVSSEPVTVMVLASADEPGRILARVGVFYSGIVAGCNCADDPTPVEPLNEYCELEITIDKATAQASIVLLPD